jgi:hypothetical protein
MKNSKRKPSHILLNYSAFVLVVGLSTVSANAAPSKSPTLTPKEEKAATAVQASQESKSKLLWNSWYTMTIGEKIPYQNQLWRTEEGFINEEKVVSFGKDDENVTPLLFNFNGIYRESEINIDGTFSGTTLKVKARRNKQALPPVEASVSSKAFLSTLFQAWIGKHLAGLTLGKRLTFITLFEDLGLDNHYAPINGSITLEADDDFAKKTGTKKLSVETADEKSIWHVLPSGEAVRIEKPGQHLVIEKKTEAEARRFLVKRTDKPE